jgi:hypothetical protein
MEDEQAFELTINDIPYGIEATTTVTLVYQLASRYKPATMDLRHDTDE